MNTGYGSFLTKIIKFNEDLLLKYSISIMVILESKKKLHFTKIL